MSTSESANAYASAALPFEAARHIGQRQQLPSTVVALLGTLLLHGSGVLYSANAPFELSAFARSVMARTQASLTAEIDVDLKVPEPEPEPPPEPDVPPPEMVAPVPSPASQQPQTPSDEPPPPPAAAQAGQVLAAESDPDEPLDLTGNTFVVGTGTYAGGITASSGTSRTAVYDRKASPAGVAGGSGQKPSQAASSGPDLSRKVRPASTNWNCPFPPEADVEQINYMRVSVVVQVDAAGKPQSVNVLNDPGYGFGRAARQCALRQSYTGALDRQGKPIAQTLTTNITFTR